MAFSHDDAIGAILNEAPAFTLTVVVTATSLASPKSFAPLFFTDNPLRQVHDADAQGFSIGNGPSQTVLEVRMADGSGPCTGDIRCHGAEFTYASPLNLNTRNTIVVTCARSVLGVCAQ